MLSKLALRNVKRSMKDYSVYMITVTIAFSLMYAFNMVVFSDDIQGLNQTLSSLSIVIVMISSKFVHAGIEKRRAVPVKNDIIFLFFITNAFKIRMIS